MKQVGALSVFVGLRAVRAWVRVGAQVRACHGFVRAGVCVPQVRACECVRAAIAFVLVRACHGCVRAGACGKPK
jgi:hypothetical protein